MICSLVSWWFREPFIMWLQGVPPLIFTAVTSLHLARHKANVIFMMNWWCSSVRRSLVLSYYIWLLGILRIFLRFSPVIHRDISNAFSVFEKLFLFVIFVTESTRVWLNLRHFNLIVMRVFISLLSINDRQISINRSQGEFVSQLKRKIFPSLRHDDLVPRRLCFRVIQNHLKCFFLSVWLF